MIYASSYYGTNYIGISNHIDSNMTLDQYFSETKIHGVEYKPYSYSKMCFGVKEILLVYQTILIIVILFWIRKSLQLI